MLDDKRKFCIAILGWGSLINEPGTLLTDGQWQEDGPVLPIEFSRISQSRNDALTLVIDTEYGTPVRTFYSESASLTLEDAIRDLSNREGAPSRKIGFVDLKSNSRWGRDSGIVSTIWDWAENHGWDAVIWTDLEPNFSEKTKYDVFSIENGIEYLMRLQGKCSESAWHYFSITPESVMTGLKVELLKRKLL